MVDRSASKMFVKMAFVYGGSLATIQKKKGKISFLSLNFHKSLFLVPKLSKLCFSSLNFAKHSIFVLLSMSVSLCHTWPNEVLMWYLTWTKLFIFKKKKRLMAKSYWSP